MTPEEKLQKKKNYIKGWKIFFYVLVALFIVTFIAVTIAIYGSLTENQNAANPTTVKTIDLEKYMGDWFELWRLPTFFEQGCANVVASYSLNSNGSINVSNTCDAYGETVVANGTGLATGRVDFQAGVLTLSPATIKVSFFGPFFAPYWIIDADIVNYEWAMIGSPSRNFLWILSRSKTLDPLIFEMLFNKARDLNFPVWDLQKTIQV